MRTNTLVPPARWVSTGGRGSAGAGAPNRASISSGGPAGMGVECVRQGERKGESDQRMLLCSFSKHSPGGTFYIWPRSPPSSPPTPLFLPTTLSRSDFWRPEYICLARAASTSHQPGTNALPWEQKTTEGGEAGGKGWQRTEPGALQGGGPRALVVEWI